MKPASPLLVRLAGWLPLATVGIFLMTLGWGASRSAVRPEADPFRDASLMSPDPRVSPSKAILLHSQYRYFLRFRRDRPESPARRNAARQYNLFTAECSPDVFEATGLPRSVR